MAMKRLSESESVESIEFVDKGATSIQKKIACVLR